LTLFFISEQRKVLPPGQRQTIDISSMKLSPRPHQRHCRQKPWHCRRNRRHCRQVAGFGDNVVRNFVLATRNWTCSICCDFVARTSNKLRSSVRLLIYRDVI